MSKRSPLEVAREAEQEWQAKPRAYKEEKVLYQAVVEALFREQLLARPVHHLEEENRQLREALQMSSPPIACRCMDPLEGDQCLWHQFMQQFEAEG